MERKLSVGETIGEAFATYRDQAGVLLPVAFWVFLVAAAIEAAARDDLALLTLASVVALLLGVLYEGIVIYVVRDLRDGKRDSSLGDLAREVLPVAPRMIAVLVLVVVPAFLGLLLLIVPGLYLMTIWAVVLQAVVLERRGLLESLGRSRELVRGNGWPVLGVVLATLLISLGLGIVLTSLVEGSVEGELIRVVFIALATSVTAPVTGLVTTALYYRLLGIQDEQTTAPDSVLEQSGYGPR